MCIGGSRLKWEHSNRKTYQADDDSFHDLFYPFIAVLWVACSSPEAERPVKASDEDGRTEWASLRQCWSAQRRPPERECRASSQRAVDCGVVAPDHPGKPHGSIAATCLQLQSRSL